MSEVFGDAWDMLYSGEYDALCITTNGALNRFGQCVMGRGIALQFKNQYPSGAKILGDKIKKNGNIFQPIMWNEKMTFIAFPVKHVWNQKADMELIKRSMISLADYAKENPSKKILLPRPGCGNGQLDWADVKKWLLPMLPNNVYVVHFKT